MKTHHLILLTTIVFTVLFYNMEGLGINLGLLGILLSVLTLIKTKERNKTKEFLILFVLSILSSLAFMWYGDFVSFLAISCSLLLLRFKAQNKNLKAIVALPVMVLNHITFPCRFFDFDRWLPNSNTQFKLKNFIVLIIPIVLFSIFFIVYSLASDTLSIIYLYDLDLDIWVIITAILGFYISFNYWNFSAGKFFLKRNKFLQNEFSEEDKRNSVYSTTTFLDLDTERKSGVLTFILLNSLLFIFILIFNYEQFFSDKSNIDSLSSDIHHRVNIVILSIVMAVLLLMFYFKSYHNFNEQNSLLKKFAKTWIMLNALLVFSSMIKNTEYIYHLGLTYKRLGVYAFLILCIIGLFFAFKKLQNKKTNIYLFNQMIWYFYGTVLLCSFLNWGYIITAYNIYTDKVDIDYLNSLEYNDALMLEYFPNETHGTGDIIRQQEKSFLYKVLYYETFNLDKK